MRKSISNVTFAVYPAPRGFGYVLFDTATKPITYGTATARPICNNRLLKRFEKYLEYYQPELVILHAKSGKFNRRSKRVQSLLNQLEREAKKRSLPTFSYNREQIRGVFAQFDATSKYEISQVILKWLPDLKHIAPEPRKLWQNEHYHMAVFDAVSLAITHAYLSQ
jgi:hypothetical protein